MENPLSSTYYQDIYVPVYVNVFVILYNVYHIPIMVSTTAMSILINGALHDLVNLFYQGF